MDDYKLLTILTLTNKFYNMLNSINFSHQEICWPPALMTVTLEYGRQTVNCVVL